MRNQFEKIALAEAEKAKKNIKIGSSSDEVINKLISNLPIDTSYIDFTENVIESAYDSTEAAYELSDKEITFTLDDIENNDAVSTNPDAHAFMVSFLANSNLGKTASAAGQLKYQINFIKSAQVCLNTLDKNSPSYTKILAAKNYKETHLMYFFNTMLFKEPELNRTWQLTTNELTTEPAGFSDTVFALKQLVLIKQQIKAKEFSTINSDSIFSALEQLNKFQFNQALLIKFI